MCQIFIIQQEMAGTKVQGLHDKGRYKGIPKKKFDGQTEDVKVKIQIKVFFRL